MKFIHMSVLIKHWKFAIAGLGLLLAGLSVYGQQGEAGAHPFWDRSDTGEIVHVLPGPASIRSPRDTQPTFAPPQSGASVYPASYGSGNLLYHGGNVMKTPAYYAIYWNSAVANSTATSLSYPTIHDQITAFIGTFFTGTSYTGATTDDYTIVDQYRDSSGTAVPAGLGLLATVVDTKATQSNIKDSAIRSYLAGLFNSGKLPVNASGILRPLSSIRDEGDVEWRDFVQKFLRLSQPLHLQRHRDQVRGVPVSGLLGMQAKFADGSRYADDHQQPRNP